MDNGDKDFVRLAALAAESNIPDGHGYILLIAPYGSDGVLRYTSNIRREDAINLLKEFLITASGQEEWMKHIR